MDARECYSSRLKEANDAHPYLYTAACFTSLASLRQFSSQRRAALLHFLLGAASSLALSVIEMQSQTFGIIRYSLICFQIKFRSHMAFVRGRLRCYDLNAVKLVIKFAPGPCRSMCLFRITLRLSFARIMFIFLQRGGTSDWRKGEKQEINTARFTHRGFYLNQ